jgi:hypothetical protein
MVRPGHAKTHILTSKNPLPSGPVNYQRVRCRSLLLKEQRIALYDAGRLLVQSAVSTGMKAHPTPMGVFSVIQREKYHESNIYSNAPMPLMQRLTWSGIALHAGILPGYPASHGCIRLSYRFAKQLWGATKIGTRVIVSREAVAPIEVTHPVLFRPGEEQSAEMASSNPLGNFGDVQGRSYGETITANNSFGDVLATTPSDGADGARSAPTGSAGQTNGIINPAEPVSIFISAKERRLFIRQRFKPILDVPLAIRNPGVPLGGTYVFTGMGTAADGGVRWTVVSLINNPQERSRKRQAGKAPNKYSVSMAQSDQEALAALDRIEISKDAVAQISKMLVTGSSLIISDEGISTETGKGTDFVVLTPESPEQLVVRRRRLSAP